MSSGFAVRSGAIATAVVASLVAVAGWSGATAQTPKRGGTIVVAAAGEPACLNWLQDCRGSDVFEEVLKGAFEIGPRHIAYELVSGVGYTRKPPFTLTYHIRPEARWRDGVPVTAGDFVFTQEAIRKYADSGSDAADQRKTVRSVRALDPKTVRVVLNGRTAFWRQLFGVVLPRHALAGIDLSHVWQDRIDNPKTGAPIGSGPFLVESWERGKELTLVRNTRYWGTHPAYLDRIVLRFGLTDPAQALRDGEVDVVHRRPDLGQVPGVERIFGPGRIWQHFEIRIGAGGHPALENKLVRRALAYGIDRDAIVKAAYGAFLPKWKPSNSAVLLNTSHGYRPNWSRYRYRPALARRLLEQAGCRRGSEGIYVCAGEPLSLRFVTPAGGPLRRIALELAQKQLRPVGVEAIPSYAVAAAFSDQILVPGNFDVALFTYSNTPDEGTDSDIYRCLGAENVTGYCQRIVTRELDQADRILDPAQRARVLNRADKQMAKDVPVIPMWTEPGVVTVRSTVHGVVACFPSLFCNAENWWLER